MFYKLYWYYTRIYRPFRVDQQHKRRWSATKTAQYTYLVLSASRFLNLRLHQRDTHCVMIWQGIVTAIISPDKVRLSSLAKFNIAIKTNLYYNEEAFFDRHYKLLSELKLWFYYNISEIILSLSFFYCIGQCTYNPSYHFPIRKIFIIIYFYYHIARVI